MTILGSKPEEWHTSDWLAGSINNINAVIVRKEISVPREAGLVESKKVQVALIRENLNQITIAEIYNAVKNSEVLGKKKSTS